MKVGIVTIIDYQNYGNRLQNYAVQKILQTCGFEVNTIINPQYFNDLKYVKGNYIQKAKNIIKSNPLFFNIISLLKSKKLSPYYSIRQNKFRKFTKKNIIISELELHYSYKKVSIPQYDYFVVGSDQVWNPNIARASWIDFLQFAPENKRIAYAVSIGLDEIPKEREKQFKKYISGMKYISVREQRAKEIIEELTNKKADVVLDPTIMLSPIQWKKISSKPNINIPNRYILLYFLGYIDDTRKNFLANYARENNLSIIDLNNLLDSNNNIYIADPGEWVYLIANCSCLFTDSFHGCVFSIIHHKDFYVFHRMKNDGSDAGMFSRINTLMSIFKLENRIQENNNYKELNNITNDEFSYVDSIIEYEKKRTYELLKGVMNND